MSHPPSRNSHGIAICLIYPDCFCIYSARKIKATTASPKIDCFQTKVFRALKQCVSERVPSWSSRCCSSRPTGCCGVAILWICAPIDLPKPRRQPFCVQVRHLSLSSSCSCRQDKSLDFLWCGQEEGDSGIGAVSSTLAPFLGPGGWFRLRWRLRAEVT